MPPKLNQKDRKLFLGAGIVFILLVVGAMIFTVGQGTRVDKPSTYSSASGGAKAAYLLLHESGYNVRRWEQPLNELPEAAGKILIMAEPEEAPGREERARLDKFISDGGHVIATGMFAGTFLPKASSVPDFLGGMTWKKATALSPSRITRAAPEIVLSPQAYWSSNTSELSLYGDGEHSLVVKYAYGKGEVIWWASATPLTNAGLKEQGNLEFFLACLGSENGEILWDEYIHGYRPTLAASVSHSPVKWVFLQLALLSLAVLVTFSRRSGPVCSPAVETRLSPLEFVHTLGGLYQRAGAASVAVDVSYQRFRYWLARRLGMATSASVEDMQSAIQGRWQFSDERLPSILKQCESARYDPYLPASEALQLIQELDEYASKLKLYRTTRKEKV